MADFIVETDLGHDPDDFFTLCHLVTAGHSIRCLAITPGSPEQVAVASFLRKVTAQDFTIGVAKDNPRPEKTGVHEELLRRHGCSLTAVPDGKGEDLVRSAHERFPNSDFLLIGPAPSVGRYLHAGGGAIGRLTMQGGFLPYHCHDVPCIRLPQFEGKPSMPSFNMNGDRKAVEAICAATIGVRRFAGKNVCHTIVFNRDALTKLATPRDPASELYSLGMKLYLERREEKKFHDPTALVCHLHPEVGVWVRGRVEKYKDGWTTAVHPEGDFVLADVDRERLWHHLLNWS